MRVWSLAALLVTLSFAAPAAALPPHAPCPPARPRRALPLRVVDGDTFRLWGERIRIVGIDAPERGQPGAGRATARLGVLLRGGPLTIIRRGRDVYCRTLAAVYVNGWSVAAVMRAEGLAKGDRPLVRFREGVRGPVLTRRRAARSLSRQRYSMTSGSPVAASTTPPPHAATHLWVTRKLVPGLRRSYHW